MLLATVTAMAYVAELIVVLPLLILTRRFERIGLGACVLGGLFIRALAAAVLDCPAINLTRWRYYVTSSAAGVFCAGLYWAVLTWWPAPAPDPPGMTERQRRT
jgi:hypothetical protein